MERKEKLEMFSARLRELRQEKRLRQREMAGLLGCTLGHYQKIEYGQVNVPITTLIALAEKFRVTTDYLLGRSDERE